MHIRFSRRSSVQPWIDVSDRDTESLRRQGIARKGDASDSNASGLRLGEPVVGAVTAAPCDSCSYGCIAAAEVHKGSRQRELQLISTTAVCCNPSCSRLLLNVSFEHVLNLQGSSRCFCSYILVAWSASWSAVPLLMLIR